MGHDFFQACYAHPDTGWAVINTSADIPKGMVEDFSSVEKGNAGAASGALVSMGKNETPNCMYEIYCKNDVVGLVRIQYGLSDGQGRPVSFAHGYLFPDAYELLKDPNNFLCVGRENFADQRVSEEERLALRAVPGAVNRALIEKSAPEMMPEELLKREPFTLQDALQKCELTEASYRTLIMAVYTHLLSSNTEKNLYIKTDGTEEYAWNLLYLIYSAIPYSMRPLLSASTCLHAEQHNTKLIFCVDLPNGMPQIDPVSGNNNIMSDTVEKRTKERNPFTSMSLGYTMLGKQDVFFRSLEAWLQVMGNERLNTMQAMNLACSFSRKEFDIPKRLPGILYNWLALPVQNTKDWETVVCFLLQKAAQTSVDVGEEVRKKLLSRMETAVTERFIDYVGQYLTSSDERK